MTEPRLEIDGLTAVLLFSSVLYWICFVLAWRKFAILNRPTSDPSWSTKKLLVLSAGLASFLRILSFIGVSALNVANVKAHYSIHRISGGGGSSPSQQDKNQGFYDGTLTVMFDLPNCIVVSTYVLLTIVWAECFMESRFHTESSRVHRKRVLAAYMLFNSALYGTITILYILIFATFSSNVVIRTVLYVTVTGVNFTAVFLVFLLYIYLNITFSGYPFRSIHLKHSLGQISTLMVLWTFSRLIWGVAMLLVYIFNIELLQESDTPGWSFITLLILFVLCEIVPMIALLDVSYRNIMGFETNASNDIRKLASGIIRLPSETRNKRNCQEGASGIASSSSSVTDIHQGYGTLVDDLYGIGPSTMANSPTTPLLREYSENGVRSNGVSLLS
jgi:hypothetical protein